MKEVDALPPDHIRLLAIEPGQGSDICCRLLTTSLAAAPPYEALSYHWGSPDLECAITCNGRPAFITPNLNEALQHLRKPDQERLVWVDMLCIDQSNQTERSEQVGIMRDIFIHALRVIVWLGSEAKEDRAAFELLDIFDENFKEHGTWYIGYDQFRGLPNLSDPRWVALVHLYRRPYFSRIWVAQEIAMAREIVVVCGSFSREWDVISNVAQVLRRSAQIGPYNPSYVFGVSATFIMNLLRDAQKSGDATWILFALLRLTRRFKATDIRDKVFAVLGIVTDPSSIGIKPDYRLTAEEVFTRVAVHELEVRQNLELLAMAGTTQTLKVPSWVPDWSFSDGGSAIAGVGNASKMTASLDSTPILSVSPDKKVLTIRGAVIDSIARVSDTVIPNAYDHTTEAKQKESMARGKVAIARSIAFAETAVTFPPGHTREEALWRTLCCDLTVDVPVSRAPAEWAIGWKMAQRQYERVKPDGDIDKVAFEAEVARDFQPNDGLHFVALASSITGHSTGRILAVTSEGRLAYVPQRSLVGDAVCILFGSKVPLILRESPLNRFRLLGESYVHGVMNGEAMEDGDLRSRARDFDIE